MKIIILKNNLVNALNSIEKGISESASLPILKNFLVKASQGEINFLSTNLEIAVKYKTLGKIIEEGEIVIPFQIFNSVVRNLNAEKITIQRGEKNKILLSAESYSGVIQDQDPKEFPIIPQVSSQNVHIKTKTELIKNIFKNIIPSVQYSTIRPEISGIYVTQKDNFLVFVGTDSFRLVEIKMSENSFVLNSKNKNISLIIPIKTCQEFVRMFNESEDIDIYFDDNQILFKTEKEELISRLIDGNYPDYESVMPKEFISTVYLEREEFLNAIKLISNFTGKTNDILLKTGEDGKYLEVSSSEPSLGEGVYKIPIKLKGEEFKIIFNWKYIFDGLKIFNSKNIYLYLNSSEKPAKIGDLENTNVSYIVMPIRG